MDLEMKFVYVNGKNASINGGRIILPHEAIYAILYEANNPQNVYRYFWVMNSKSIGKGIDFVIWESDNSGSLDGVFSIDYSDKYAYLSKMFIMAYMKTKSIQKRKRSNNENDSKYIDAVCSILIHDIVDNKRRQYYIVSNKVYDDHARYIYHYTSNEARELLSAALLPRRIGMGSIDGHDIRVEKVVYFTANGEMPEDMRPKTIIIQRNGGMYASMRLGEIVDLLLYSPFTNRFEIIKATKDRFMDYCFTDLRLFREFVEKYGNPGVRYEFRSQGTKPGVYMELREKSILNEYGYNVGSSDNLSTDDRQTILAEIIDLNIMRQYEILKYLQFFISSHTGSQYHSAQAKWKEDYSFVLHYRQNAERFLIAKAGYK